MDDPRFTAPDSAAAALDYAVTLDLGHVRGRDGREARNVRGTIAGTGSRLDALAVDGTLVPSGSFQARMDADDGGTREVHVTSTDAGA